MNVKNLDTKTKILEVAIKLFASKGVEVTTFSDIAKKCSVSQPNIYNHFNNKMDLVKACALFSAEKGRKYIDEKAHADLSAEMRLKNFIMANLNWFFENPTYGHAVHAIYYYAGSNKEMNDLYQKLVITGTQRLKMILAQGERESLWKIEKSDLIARSIHNLLVGEVYRIRFAKNEKDILDAGESIWQTLQIMVNQSIGPS